MSRRKKPRRGAPEFVQQFTPKPGSQPASSAATPPRGTLARFRAPLVALALAAIAFLAYSNSFHTGFAQDNRILILKDARVHAATGENLDLILNRTYWWPENESALYRPVTTLTYLFNYAILGNADAPAGYHWFNFLLHAANVFLVYLLALRLLKTHWPPFFIAALWAVHPVATESVTNIIGRSDLLAAFALLSGFLLYLKSADASGWRRLPWLAALAGVTALGVFSKESAVAILGVIALYELTWWRERRQWRALLAGSLAIALPLAAMLYQRAAVMAAATPTVFNFVDNPLLGAHSLAERLTPVAVMAKYIWLLAWPAKLSCDYSYAQIPLSTGALRDWIAWLVVAAVAAAIALQFRRNRLYFFFGAFAFVVFVPVSNLLVLTGTIMAERFLYLPSLGFAACLVMALFAAGQRFGVKLLAPIALALIIAALGLRTCERNFDWQSDLTLWTAAGKTSPASAKVHSAIAFNLSESDPTHSNIYNVIEESDKALAILDPLPDSLNQLPIYVNGGAYYLKKGDLLARPGAEGQPATSSESRLAWQRALQILLRGVSINNVFGEAYKQADLARGKLASEIPPVGSPELFQKLSIAYQRLGDLQKAYDAALQARVYAPHRTDSYFTLANILMSGGHKEEAAVALVEASLISGNRAILGQLQKLYQVSGLDPQGCAFAASPGGPILNVACAPVKKELCAASSDLYSLYLQVRRLDLADQAKSAALRDFGCPADLIR